MQDRAQAIAAALLRARQVRDALFTGDDPGPANLEEAYRAQDIVLEALSGGRRASAWKVSPPRVGEEPVAAPVPGPCVLESPVRVAAANYRILGVEAEIAFRIGRDLPAQEAPYDEGSVAAAVSEAVVLIELVDTRLANWRKAPALLKLADFQSNGALVIGSGARDWQALDFARQSVVLEVDGALRVRATGTHPAGNPFRLLPWLAAHCARRCGGLRAGDVVTTGSWTGLEFVPPGAAVVARFPGIGEARLQIDR